jgi:hypothetical protein
MKIQTVLAALILVIAGRAAAQDTPPPPPAMDDAMMKYIEATSPNEHHKKLAVYLGTWDAESSFWMDGPDQPPVTSRGTARITWAYGGRFLKQDFDGYFMGMPMQGLGFNGYDNLKKVYTMFWIDNTSTNMATATGGYDTSGTVLTLTGTSDDPLTGVKDMAVKYVLRMTEKDRFVFEMFQSPKKGKFVKAGEVVYTRAAEHR